MRIERHVLFWLTAAVALFLLVALLRDVLLPFVAGMVIAYFLNPLADRLQQIGLGRTAAALVIVLFAGALAVSAMVLIVPVIGNQLRLMAESLPGDLQRLLESLEAWLSARLGNRYPVARAEIEKALEHFARSSGASLATIVTALWSQGIALISFLSLILVTPVVVFYLLVDWHPMLAKVDSWLPRENAETIRRLAGEINEAVAAFIRGQGTICILLAVLYAVALSAAGIRYGLLIGIGTGILTFIPYVGWTLGLLTASAIALIQSPSEFTPLFLVLAIYAGGMALDVAVLSPKIVGGRIGLHPVWLMFALFAFSYLFGFVGVLVAVPVAAAIGVLVRYGLEVYLGSTVYRGAGKPPGAPGAMT